MNIDSLNTEIVGHAINKHAKMNAGDRQEIINIVSDFFLFIFILLFGKKAIQSAFANGIAFVKQIYVVSILLLSFIESYLDASILVNTSVKAVAHSSTVLFPVEMSSIVLIKVPFKSTSGNEAESYAPQAAAYPLTLASSNTE